MSDADKPPATPEARLASLEAIVRELIDNQLELLLAATSARRDFAELLGVVAGIASLTDDERARLTRLQEYAAERAGQLELQRQRADDRLLEDTKA